MNVAKFFVLLALLCSASQAKAYSPIIELRPGQPNRGFDTVDISPERLGNGDVQFTVTIVSKIQLGRDSVSLGIVRTTEHSGESRGLRRLAWEMSGNAIKCVFSVTEKDLAEADLSFRLTSSRGAWAFTTYFLRLNDVLKQ